MHLAAMPPAAVAAYAARLHRLVAGLVAVRQLEYRRGRHTHLRRVRFHITAALVAVTRTQDRATAAPSHRATSEAPSTLTTAKRVLPGGPVQPQRRRPGSV
jgi:hypothetical protein